jgi:hypothetical protein
MKFYLSCALLILAALTACGTFEVSVADPAAASTVSPVSADLPTPSPSPDPRPIVVAFVEDGNIQLWDQRTEQKKTIFASGDVSSVTMSEDSRIIVFTRRTRFEQPELREQFSLWAVERDGSNPRQLVAPDSLRERLGPADNDSTGFAQLEWIPGSHRLIYSLKKYYLPGQGFSYSQDLYAADADSGADGILAAGVLPAEEPSVLKFIPSPDGAQLALLSMDSLGFLGTDGQNRRDKVLTYPDVFRGDEPAVLATGAWTEDGRSFILAAPQAQDEQFNITVALWKVPADGGEPESLASVERSHPLSITFSPGGDHFAYLHDEGPSKPPTYLTSPLSPAVGPLSLPAVVNFNSYANLYWAPSGAVFNRDLIQLCPEATDDSNLCTKKFEFGSSNIESVRWIDSGRLLVLTRQPPVLFYSVDGEWTGTATPIVAWAQPEQSHSYSAVFETP